MSIELVKELTLKRKQALRYYQDVQNRFNAKQKELISSKVETRDGLKSELADLGTEQKIARSKYHDACDELHNAQNDIKPSNTVNMDTRVKQLRTRKHKK